MLGSNVQSGSCCLQVTDFDVRRLTNLARLTGHLIASFNMSLAVAKVGHFADAMPAQEVLLWRVCFHTILQAAKDTDTLVAIFARVAAQEALHEFCTSIKSFLHHTVRPWLADKDTGLLLAFNSVQRALPKM